MDERTVELEDLVGEHLLDGCDDGVEGYGSATAIRFRLDGVAYVAIENESDGYRSMLDKVIVQDGYVVKNTFPGHRVFGRLRLTSDDSPEMLELVDLVTSKVVIAVGTDYSYDYYPCFVGSFAPENMAVNQPIGGYEG